MASGHIGQPAATGSRRALQYCTVRSAPRPLNNVLPPSTPGVKRRRMQRNACNKWPTTWLESVRGHDTYGRKRFADSDSGRSADSVVDSECVTTLLISSGQIVKYRCVMGLGFELGLVSQHTDSGIFPEPCVNFSDFHLSIHLSFKIKIVNT